MKKLVALFPATMLALGGVAMTPSAVFAQAAPAASTAKEELVKISKVNVGVQKTPKIVADGPTDKRWKPKDWLEIEVDCEAKLSKKATDKKQTTYPEVTFKYYVYLEGQSTDKSRILTGEVAHTNVPIGEPIHSVMYVTPSTILNLTGKPEGNASAVKFWGVEVLIGGEEVGRKTSQADKPWWEAPKAPAKEAGLKNKMETPFAILWGDYHLDVRGGR